MREAPFSKGVLSIIIIKLLYEYHGYAFGAFISYSDTAILVFLPLLIIELIAPAAEKYV